MLQVGLPLDEVIRLPGRPAIFRALEVVFLPVDPRTGAVLRDEEVPSGPGAGTPVTDPELLRAVEEVLTGGCRDDGGDTPG